VSPELGMRLENLAIKLGLEAVGTVPGYISINVSPATILSARFWTLMHECDGKSVVLELTEHVEVSDYAQYQGALAALRRLGVRVAVDDAGAGYAGLCHILALSPEIIKMDRSIVENVVHDLPTREMLAAILGFVRAHNGALIAEGVETADHATALTALGFRYGQGYYFGRPKPIETCPARSVPEFTSALSLPGASYGTTRRRGGFTAVATREKSVRFPARPPTSIRESTELRRVHPSRQLTVAVAPVGDVAALQGYICSSRNTSRLRKVGGPSQSAASCAANSLVSGRSEFAIASS